MASPSSSVHALGSRDWALPNVSFHRQHLDALLAAHVGAYRTALPFPHTVIESLMPLEVVRAVASEIPEQILQSGCVPGAAVCYRKKNVHFRKSEIHHNSMGMHTRALFAALRSRVFVKFLERLSGIRPLIPDPGYQGSGVHLTGSGGILKVHHDFNFMLCRRLDEADGGGSRYGDCKRGANMNSDGRSHRLHRRVNVFFYLNDDWPDHYNGHLELWARNMSTCHKRILPSFGRFVAFSSTDFSLHGHPAPMDALPQNRLRRSIAFYYYSTLDRPKQECEDGDCFSFHDAVWKDPIGCPSCSECSAGVAPPVLQAPDPD